MAVQTINLAELKEHKIKLESYKRMYDAKISDLLNTVKSSIFYWQGEDANNYRSELNKLISTDLNIISNEMNAEIEYIKRLIMVLENAQEQIKNRLNS